MKSLRHAVALLVPALFAIGATLSFLVFGVARRVVTPMRRPVDTRILAVDTGAQTIELGRTDDTELPGRYGLFTTGTYGYVMVGAVLGADATSVRRKLLTKIETGARVDGGASFSGYYYASPSELHIIPTIGSARCQLIGASSWNTWWRLRPSSSSIAM